MCLSVGWRLVLESIVFGDLVIVECNVCERDEGKR